MVVRLIANTLLAVALLGCPTAAPQGAGELTLAPLPSLPLDEVSGLAFDGQAILAIGDEARLLVRLRWADPLVTAGAERLTLPLPDLPGGSQLEAVAVAPGGALVLDEERALVHLLAFDDGPTVRVAHTFRLHVPADHPLGAEWAAQPNRRGEGLARLPGGHLLVAKQRQPLVLVEFGPLGATPVGVTREGLAAPGAMPDDLADELFPLAVWEAGGEAAEQLRALRDLAVGRDGALYVLTDREGRTLARVALPLATGASTFALESAWAIVGSHEGTLEGLAFLPDGRALIAVDAASDQPNLAILPRPR